MILRKCFTILLLSLTATVYAKETIPEWAAGAVWYQILPERFRNINPSDDPVKSRVVGDGIDDWQVHPWASDWYKLQVWEEARHLPFAEIVADRRYGGDLIGVIEKLPYLKDFGVDVIYLMPIFESPSVEKYDASTFHHVDNNFGLERDEDWKSMQSEDENPENWQLTTADEVFIDLLKQAHELEMRVVTEVVFSYCGLEFWAFKDLEENQEESKYKDWFEVLRWDDPMTPDTVEFDYECWQGDRGLPVFKKTADGDLVEPVRKYIFDSTRRWMDPDSDSVVIDGVDGWLVNEVADLPAKFWAEWNDLVHSFNPDALTISDYSADAKVVGRQQFDLVRDRSVSNRMVDFFVHKRGEFSLSAFMKDLKAVGESRSNRETFSMLNQVDSYKTYRIASLIVNANSGAADGVSADNGYHHYNPIKPDSTHRKIQKLLTLFQLTYPGAPVIFYGDESGMWGGEYPDNIKPMLWREFIYEKEAYTTIRWEITVESSSNFDRDIFNLYRKINHVRRDNPALRVGQLQVHIADDDNQVLVYSRKHKRNEVYVFMNLSSVQRHVELRPGWRKNSKVRDPFSTGKYKLDIFDIKLDLEPFSYRVLVKEK